MTETVRVKDWFVAGSRPDCYAAGRAEGLTIDGKSVALIRSIADPGDGFGTLMQEVAAGAFRGRRISFSGRVRGDVAGWAGLWMRIDGTSRARLGFDNMQDRAIRGQTDWARHAVTLDVPAEAELVAFGILLSGTGEFQVSDLTLDVVGPEVPVTGWRSRAPAQPRNLDFAEVAAS